jgi:hypothetical protein
MSRLRSIVVVAVAYCALFGAALWLWLRAQAPQSLAIGAVCALPALLALLVLTRHRGDPSQLIAKTCACMLMPPVLMLMWAGEQVPAELRIWPAMVGFCVLQASAFIGFILWAAPRSTRVEPVEGVSALSVAELQQRIAALPEAGLGVRLLEASADTSVLEYVHASEAARVYRFVAQLDAHAHTLYVREQESASAAAPRDAAEADMRPLGSVGIDPTRPAAQSVYSKSTNATFLDPTRLAAVAAALQVANGAVRFASPTPHDADAKHVAYALAALTTGAGWTYQPILFDFQRPG